MLGGVRVGHSHGLVAHSDGDVLLHALSDALLGACALGDIGKFFPDDDPTWRGADSKDLLTRVFDRVHGLGWNCVNVDCTVMCERPRIASHVPQMKNVIASILQCSPDAVGIKGTTVEKLGFVGREEGLAAQAVVLLCRSQPLGNPDGR